MHTPFYKRSSSVQDHFGDASAGTGQPSGPLVVFYSSASNGAGVQDRLTSIANHEVAGSSPARLTVIRFGEELIGSSAGRASDSSA